MTMKTILSLIFGLLLALPAAAQQYGVISTLTGGGTYTVPASSASNLNAAVTCTRYDEFVLDVRFALADTNLVGNLDFRWSVCNDGVCYTTGLANPGASGWFRGPAVNGTNTVFWHTNVAVNSFGFWRIDYITNGAGAVLTNLAISAYAKPRRSG